MKSYIRRLIICATLLGVVIGPVASAVDLPDSGDTNGAKLTVQLSLTRKRPTITQNSNFLARSTGDFKSGIGINEFVNRGPDGPAGSETVKLNDKAVETVVVINTVTGQPVNYSSRFLDSATGILTIYGLPAGNYKIGVQYNDSKSDEVIDVTSKIRTACDESGNGDNNTSIELRKYRWWYEDGGHGIDNVCHIYTTPPFQPVATAAILGPVAYNGKDQRVGSLRLESYDKIRTIDSVGLITETEIATDGTDDLDTCNISGIGWIICPLSKFIAGITDAAYSVIASLLRIDLNHVDSKGVVHSLIDVSSDPSKDNYSTLFATWSNIRNLANICFILVFFLVIFSQATSIGLSSYGVKKLLPRLFMAAILVNLSYYICVLGVDIANILGAGLDTIFRSALGGVGYRNSDFSSITSKILGVGVLGAAGAGAVLYPAALGLLPPILIGSLIAILTVVTTIAVAKAIIVIGIVTSPIWMLASALPSTEDLGRKGRKLFMGALLLYPGFTLIYGATQVGAGILEASADSSSVSGMLLFIMAEGVRVSALLLGFFALKLGGAAGRLAGKLNNPNKGPLDKLRKKTERGVQRTQANRNKTLYGKETPKFTGRTAGLRRRAQRMFTPSGMVQRNNDADRGLEQAKQGENLAAAQYFARRVNDQSDPAYANRMAGGNRFRQASGAETQRVQAGAYSALEELREKSTREAATLMVRDGTSGDRDSLKRIILDRGSSAAQVGAATDFLLKTAGTEEYREILENHDVMRNHGATIVQAGKKNEGVLDKKSPDVFDFINQTDAVTIAASGAGAAAQAIKSTGRLPTVSAGKMIGLDPQAMSRLIDRVRTMPAGPERDGALQYVQEQAQIAATAPNRGEAKGRTQAMIKYAAAGNFSIPPP